MIHVTRNTRCAPTTMTRIGVNRKPLYYGNETGARACNGIYYENSRNYRRREAPGLSERYVRAEGTRIMHADAMARDAERDTRPG